MTSQLQILLSKFTTLQSLKKCLYNFDIGCNYDEKRILLYSQKFNAKYWDIAQECNGVIIDRATWKVICHPTPLLSNSTPKDIAEYTAYAAMDGSVVNLYFTDKWIVSTVKGIEMNNVKWNGITWLKALQDAGLDTAKLTPGTTYTFGFSHPEMHCVTETKLWFISSFAETRTWESKEYKLQPTLEFKTLDEMRAYVALPDSYGVILRPKLESSLATHILIEGQKMQDMRRLVYDHKLTMEAHELKFDKNLFAATIAGLDKDTCVRFGILMPKFAKQSLEVWTALNEQCLLIENDVPTIWSAEIRKVITNPTKDALLQILSKRKYAAMWYNFCFPLNTDFVGV